MDALIEGSALRSGGRVRINTQLVRARPEAHLWSNSFERDLRDVLALQSEVAQAIANEVKAKLTPQEQARLTRARPVNPEAHELYLTGSDWRRRGEAKKALEYFEQAIQTDPNFARAYLGIAEVYGDLGINAGLPPQRHTRNRKHTRGRLWNWMTALMKPMWSLRPPFGRVTGIGWVPSRS